jgi:hypothetical protein
MGNLCSSNANAGKTITMQQWLTKVNIPLMTTHLGYKYERHFYHLRKGDLDTPQAGHIPYTHQLNTDFMERLFVLCKQCINSSGINDPMYETSSMILCTKETFENVQLRKKDADILNNIQGFCLCHVDKLQPYLQNQKSLTEYATPVTNTGSDILYIELLCSSEHQGGNLIDVIGDIKDVVTQTELFGGTYNTIVLTSVPVAVDFYIRHGYKRMDGTEMPLMAKIISPTKPQEGSGKVYKMYKGRSYVVRIGKKNGRYIIVNKKKIYIYK